MAGTTFPERLKSLFAYNFHRCVGHKLSWPVGVFLVVVVVQLEVFVGVDIRMQLSLMELNGLLMEKTTYTRIKIPHTGDKASLDRCG